MPPTDPRDTSIPCPVCGSNDCRMSSVIVLGTRHRHIHCPCCHRVWLEREHRAEQRVQPYQPTMSK